MKKYGRGYVYVYNPEQKEFYIDEGCNLVDSNIHKITKKVFWIFGYEDTQEVYKNWCEKEH